MIYYLWFRVSGLGFRYLRVESAIVMLRAVRNSNLYICITYTHTHTHTHTHTNTHAHACMHVQK